VSSGKEKWHQKYKASDFIHVMGEVYVFIRGRSMKLARKKPRCNDWRELYERVNMTLVGTFPTPHNPANVENKMRTSSCLTYYFSLVQVSYTKREMCWPVMHKPIQIP
jgi:hypothetical protein